MKQEKNSKPRRESLFSMVFSYKKLVGLLVVFTVLGNLISLVAPKLIAVGIDAYTKSHVVPQFLVIEFIAVTILVFIFTYLQYIIQTFTSERVARDIREKLTEKISRQNFAFVQKITPAVLLTNLTSDADGIKLFVSQAIGTLIASVCLIIGASILLLVTNWKLGLAVLLIIPIIASTFYTVLAKVRVLFKETQGVIDWLNKVINESILGASLIRVLNSQQQEKEKFKDANAKALDIGLQILKYFSIMIPVVTFVASLATLVILSLGGHFVITGSMTLGDFTAFNSYIGILIFPIIMIGFMSNVIARSQASYDRIQSILSSEKEEKEGSTAVSLKGEIELSNLTLKYGEKEILNNVTLSIKPCTKTAIIGPTAAGKTQLLYIMDGLVRPDSGSITYDGTNLTEIEKESFHKQIGFVFQDSIIFNITIRENIAFAEDVKNKDLEKAIATAELSDFIKKLPKGLDTIVSERGTSLSGGQKQRIMLARALAINPRILLLDDFTARVDAATEKKILENVQKNYPDLTLVSVTQKISSVEDYDQIILIMEGEVISRGTHRELLKTSPEYVQLYKSQHSTSHYELPTQ
jgi:ATP-binding cassette subfamily B protein